MVWMTWTQAIARPCISGLELAREEEKRETLGLEMSRPLARSFESCPGGDWNAAGSGML